MGQEKEFHLDKFPDSTMSEFYDEENREIKSIESGKIDSFYGIIEEENHIEEAIKYDREMTDKNSERWKRIGGRIGFIISIIFVIASGSFFYGLPVLVIGCPLLTYFGARVGKYIGNKYFMDSNLLSRQEDNQAAKLQTLRADKDNRVADIHEKYEKLRQDYRERFETVASEHADDFLQKEECLEILKEIKNDFGETIGIGRGLTGAGPVSGHYSVYFYKDSIVTSGIYRKEDMTSREPVDIYAWALATQKYIEDNSDCATKIKSEVKIIRTSVELAIEY